MFITYYIYQLNRSLTMTRKEYLLGLADDYGIHRADVFAIADLLGESEDYDGLLSMLADYEGSIYDLDEFDE
jgi:hypothetical protein